MTEQLIFASITVMAFLVVALVFVVVRQRQQLQIYSKPKYGFLGKPLMSIVAMGLLLSGILGGVYLIYQPDTTFETSADRQVTTAISKVKIEPTGQIDSANYRFIAVPNVGGIEYGEDGSQFDLFWRFSSLDNVFDKTLAEFSISKARPSNLELRLEPGVYELNLVVVYEDRSYNYNEIVIID